MTQLTVGLVGAGGISHAHAPSWRALGARVVVFSEVGAPALAEAYGLTVADSLDDLLAEADVVDVCTPTPSHAAVALAAIAAGRHVVCEKPLARTVEDARSLARAARAAGVQVYPGHVVRWFPEYVALRDAVNAGRLGDLAVLRFTRGGSAPTADWFTDETLSGGLVLDQMIHDLDQARWIAGEVDSVYAVQNPPSTDGRSPGILVAHIVVTHRSGAVSHIQGNWGPAGVEFVTSFDVAGSGGRASYDSRARRDVDANIPPGAAAGGYLPSLSGGNPYQAELAEFAAAFAGGPAPRVTAEDGIIAVGLAEAALESIRTGERVAVDEAELLGREETLA